MSVHRLLFIHGRRVVDRSVTRTLNCLGAEVVLQPSLSPMPRDDEYDLVIVDYDELQSSERTVLIETFKDRAGSSRLLLIVSERHDRTDMAVVFDSHATIHVVSRSQGIDSYFFVTLCKLLGGGADVFGVEKYFPWGVTSWSTQVSDSTERDDLLDRTTDLLRKRGVTERFIDLCSTIVDEGITNGLYNAPIDSAGRHLYTHLDRSTPVRLDPASAVSVSVTFDGLRLGIAITDPWGSLTEEAVLTSLSRGFRREADQIADKPGGAGVGFYYLLQSSSHLVVNISSQARTEVIALVDVRQSYRDFAASAKSFNIFSTASLEYTVVIS